MKNILYISGLAIILAAALGFLWLNWQSNNLAERNAWASCINRAAAGSGDENSPGLAENLICKSLYPGPYQTWHDAYYQ